MAKTEDGSRRATAVPCHTLDQDRVPTIDIPEPPTAKSVSSPVRLLVLCLVALASAAAVSGTASGAAPCWKTLINDWYDGRIDRVYPVACYREALGHMPADLDAYSSLRDDINRALAAVIAGKDPTAGGNGEQAKKEEEEQSSFHGGPSSGGGAASFGGRDPGGGAVGSALSSIGPDSADSVPIPLMVLGALAIMLLALGSAGFVARRIQTRRAPVRPTSKN
jgi:hypothetical protein